MPRRTLPLSPEDIAQPFECPREPELASFFNTQSMPFEDQGCGRTFVLHRDEDDPPDAPRVLGYYTLAMGRIELPADLRPEVPQPLPRLLPIGLIAQLARDSRAPGGLGAWLLADALRRLVRIAEDVGCVGVGLHARNAGLQSYYESFLFRAVEHRRFPQSMFLDMRRVRASVEEAAQPGP